MAMLACSCGPCWLLLCSCSCNHQHLLVWVYVDDITRMCAVSALQEAMRHLQAEQMLPLHGLADTKSLLQAPTFQ